MFAEFDEDEAALEVASDLDGVMGKYRKAVQIRLQLEIAEKAPQILIALSNKNDW